MWSHSQKGQRSPLTSDRGTRKALADPRSVQRGPKGRVAPGIAPWRDPALCFPHAFPIATRPRFSPTRSMHRAEHPRRRPHGTRSSAHPGCSTGCIKRSGFAGMSSHRLFDAVDVEASRRIPLDEIPQAISGIVENPASRSCGNNRIVLLGFPSIYHYKPMSAQPGRIRQSL